MSRGGKAIRGAGLGVAAVAALVALASVRVVIDSHHELVEAMQLDEAGEYQAAVTGYRRALRWYAPGNPYSRAAGEALLRLAREAESRGDTELALSAYRELRAGIMATRGVTTPYSDLLERGGDRLEVLGSNGGELGRSASRSPSPTPKPWLALLALTGYALWVGSVLGFTQRAFDREDRLIRSRALRWLAGFVIGFALFVAGLLFA